MKHSRSTTSSGGKRVGIIIVVILLSAAVIFLGVNFQPIMDIIVRGLQLM